jgi:hypothetical protein
MTHAKVCRRVAVLAVALLCPLIFGPASAQAESVVWQVQSNHPKKVQIEFYSKDRDIAWPGGGQAYNLNDYEIHKYNLTCRPGERICYGAWVTRTERATWGVGKDEAKGCDDCCWTCGRKGNPSLVTLGAPRRQSGPPPRQSATPSRQQLGPPQALD